MTDRVQVDFTAYFDLPDGEERQVAYGTMDTAECVAVDRAAAADDPYMLVQSLLENGEFTINVTLAED